MAGIITNSTNSVNNIDPRFIVQIRDQKFYVEVWIYNQNSKFKPIGIPFKFIEQLVLEESLENWYSNGYLILANDFEVFERGSYDSFPSPYFFRSDGRNKISLKIYPIIDNPKVNPLTPEYWNMNYDFVIYDIEDLPTGSSQSKLRKFYFHDERYQIFLERNIEWSTSKNDYQLCPDNSSDDVKSLNVSLAIKSIISTAASNDSNPSSPVIKIGNTDGPSKLDDPNIPLNLFDEENWDKGFAGDKVLYTAPANSCVLDDINYVYKYAKSQDGSSLFLRFDRYTRKWSLVSLKDTLNKAEKNQIERLIIQDNLNIANQKPYIPRAPYDQNGGDSSDIKNFQSNIASRITDYRLAPMVAFDEINLTNTPIHNFNFSKGSFEVHHKSNTSKYLLDSIKTIANDSLYSFKQKSGQLLYQINQTKKTGLNTKNTFIPRSVFPKDSAYLRMSKDFLFLSQAIHFTVPGLTFRTPGKFVFIDKDYSNGEQNVFDDRFLGQWILTKVIHNFTKTMYTNEIIANKIDIFNKWFDEIDTKY
jgi:hypothetical protein